MTRRIPSPISFLDLLFRGTVVMLSDILRIVHSSFTIFVTQKSHFSLLLFIAEKTFIDNVLSRGSSFVVALMLFMNNEERSLNVIGEVHNNRLQS
jgi:hypothetical protein